MPTVDLAFPLTSAGTIPADHGYTLYAAISRILPELHESNDVGIHPIRGRQVGNRQLALGSQSWLILRTDAERIARLIAVAGKSLNIAGTAVLVGIPQVRLLRPAASLRSRLVVIKTQNAPAATSLTGEIFQQAARRQLDALGVSPAVKLAVGKRRTLRIRDKEIVGYEVMLSRLRAEESVLVQERGLGDRRHMGCGVFVPVRSGDPSG